MMSPLYLDFVLTCAGIVVDEEDLPSLPKQPISLSELVLRSKESTK